MKPFGGRELMARVRALLRRGWAATANEGADGAGRPPVYKHIEIDPAPAASTWERTTST